MQYFVVSITVLVMLLLIKLIKNLRGGAVTGTQSVFDAFAYKPSFANFRSICLSKTMRID